MKYYVLEIAEGDEKIKGISASTFSDDEKTDEQNRFDAIASANQKLATSKSNLYKSDLVLVIDENGGIIDNRKLNNPYWKAKEVQPTVQPTEEA